MISLGFKRVTKSFLNSVFLVKTTGNLRVYMFYLYFIFYS